MARVVVTGNSDDLVTLAGDISDEYTPLDDKPIWLAFDDGTVLRVMYSEQGDGIWRIKVEKTGTATVDINVCTSDGEGEDYSDIATIEGAFTKVFGWDSATGPTRQQMIDYLNDQAWEEADDQLIATTYNALVQK
jgi:hypothetical protein